MYADVYGRYTGRYTQIEVHVVYAGGCIRVYAYGWYAGYTQGQVHMVYAD